MSSDSFDSDPTNVAPPPSWAVRSVDVPPPPADPGPNKKKAPAWIVPALGAGVLLIGIGVAGYFLGRGGDESATNTTEKLTEVTAGDGAAVASTASTAPTTTAPATTTPATTAGAADSTTTAQATTSPATAPETTTTTAQLVTATTSGVFKDGDTRRAVFKGGTVYLGGEVPSEEVADLIASRVAAVVGQENVVVEYTINPDAPVPDSAPLYVADLVLFTRGTADITEPFIPLLQLGTQLFSVNPNVTIDVVAHTDSESSAAFNQVLSERRANAIRDFWVAAGVDPSRITAVGKGENEPIATNSTEEGRQLNRRAEFVISGIIG